MLARPGVSRPRPKASRPRASRPRPRASRPRPSSTKQYLATHYGGTNDAGIPVYCKCNYTVIHCVWKNIGHFDLGLGFERGKAKARNTRPKALRPRPENLASRPRPNNPAKDLIGFIIRRVWRKCKFLSSVSSSNSWCIDQLRDVGGMTPLPPLGHIWHVMLVWRKWNIEKNCLCSTVLCTILKVREVLQVSRLY